MSFDHEVEKPLVGVVYCMLEAPDIHSVCEHHHARGLACDTVDEMEALDGVVRLLVRMRSGSGQPLTPTGPRLIQRARQAGAL
jgi:hypothetical protein